VGQLARLSLGTAGTPLGQLPAVHFVCKQHLHE